MNQERPHNSWFLYFKIICKRNSFKKFLGFMNKFLRMALMYVNSGYFLLNA